MYVYRPTTENKPKPKPSSRNNARAAVFERDNEARLRLDPERVDELLAAGCIEIDPAEFPILACHWSFVEPNWRPIGQVASEIVDRIGSRRAVDDEDHEAAA